ncbi:MULTISPECIES: vWA domain-containing protein [Methylobacter]
MLKNLFTHQDLPVTSFSLTQLFKLIFSAVLFCFLLGGGAATAGEGAGFAMTGGYGLKIYKVNFGFYPYVQVYFRTFDENQQPLVNLNAMNVGLMVKGKAYDPAKRQYQINSIRQRQEATRSILVLDASKSMAGPPFETALRAAARYIDSKRPQDEVAILSIRDTKTGYDVVSEFERDTAALGRRLVDVRADGTKTRLYDSIGAAMQMCGMTAQGSVTPSADNYIVSCSIVVFSDGKDDDSALSREELNGRITNLSIPIPVYSLAYSKLNQKYFKNLEAISKNSFGIYYMVGETIDRMQKVVEEIQNIIQSDYVVTFRSYLPVDGEEHAFKLGVEYPSGSGKFSYENAHFEAIEPPPLPPIMQMIQLLNQAIPPLPTGQISPYYDQPATAPTGSPAPGTPK